MLKTRKKSSVKKRIILTCLIILLIGIAVFTYFLKVVNPIVLSISESKVSSLSTKAVNSAVVEVLAEQNLYEELITITTNDAGDVVLIQANSVLINKLTKDLARASQTKLDIIGAQGVSIPLGSFTGIPLFIGRGPEIRLKLLPIGSIQCSFLSEFSQAGINQTNHKIYVNIDCTVNVVLPITNKTIKTRSQLLICENIIVGKIPEVYFGSNAFEGLQNLIPS